MSVLCPNTKVNKMMIAKNLVRFFHTGTTRWAVEKSHLALLRKKTGYTFANCKKALELHNNDIAKAETWLREQAKALGWSKATKLEGRQTTQGLVGVAINQNSAGALVEVNCETDFVAKNATFQTLVSEVATVCLNFTEKQIGTNGPLTKIGLEAEELKKLQTSDGTALIDKVALMIGSVGENATLRRGYCFKTAQPSIRLYAYAHPSGNVINDVLLGRVAGVVALRQTAPNEHVSLDEIGRGLCQHVVGMNPKRIGTADDEPAKEKDDEECLIHQEYLEDDSVTVKEVLEESGVEIVDFKRFECGEVVNAANEQRPLELIETCQ